MLINRLSLFMLACLSLGAPIASAQDAPAHAVPSQPPPTASTPAPTLSSPKEPERLLPLMVGDSAPKLFVAEWLRGEALPGLDAEDGGELPKGKVILVDFWASWCDMCINSIPSLSAIHLKHPGDVMTVAVSTSDTSGGTLESSKTAISKLEEKISSDPEMRFAWDRAGKTAAAWLAASAQRSIPVTFVIDREGRIVHIGQIVDPQFGPAVDQIVAGTWDLAAAKEAFEKRMRPIALNNRIRSAMQAKEWDRVLAAYDEVAAMPGNAERSHGIIRYIAMVELGQKEEAKAFGARLVDSPKLSKDALFLNSLAWDIVDPDGFITDRDLDLALKAASLACGLTNNRSPGYLDTLARVHHSRGDAKKAVETQERAIKIAEIAPGFPPATLASMKTSLAEYQAHAKPGEGRQPVVPTDPK